MHNFEQFLIALDQVFGVIVSSCYREKAWADMSLSALAWRWEQQRKRSYPRKIIDTIFFWQKKHCYNSWLSEIKRFHLPPDVRFENAKDK